MRVFSLSIALVIVMGVSYSQVTIVGGKDNVKLKDLVNSSTKVTIVLKENNALAANVVISGVSESHFSVRREDGGLDFYPYSHVKEIRIQDGIVSIPKPVLELNRVLSKKDQEIVNKSRQKSQNIFNTSYEDQQLKMRAAVLLSLAESDANTDAVDYLNRLSEVNDIATSMVAMYCRYLIGAELVDISQLKRGVESGNPAIKQLAITMVGLYGAQDLGYLVEKLLASRQAEKAAPAARTMAMLGDRSIETRMHEMITERNAAKAEAAVFALSRIGNAETITKLNKTLETIEGESVYRIIRVLYALGAPESKSLLTGRCMETPTFAPSAAIVLAKTGERKAKDFLQTILEQSYDKNPKNLIQRAQIATALVEGGDWNAKTILQDILRLDESDLPSTVDDKAGALRSVKQKTCELIGDMGNKKLITLLESSIDSRDRTVSIAACEAVFSIAIPEFGKRLLESRVEEPWSTAYMF